MLKHRVIPTLLLSGDRLVKTRKFSNEKYVGDPINAIRIFNEKEVDEIIVLDIDASKRNTEPNYQLIEEFASECFMPLCYGGGIKTLDQAKRIFASGIEKVSLQSSAISNIDIISQIAQNFGRQAIVVSVDIKKNWLGKRKIFSASSKSFINEPLQDYVKKLVNAGAGELLINSVDNDGQMQGMDLDLISEVSTSIPIPLIAAGGVGCLQDIKAAVEHGANAVSVGSFFVFNGPHRAVLITYPNYKVLENLLGNEK